MWKKKEGEKEEDVEEKKGETYEDVAMERSAAQAEMARVAPRLVAWYKRGDRSKWSRGRSKSRSRSPPIGALPACDKRGSRPISRSRSRSRGNQE